MGLLSSGKTVCAARDFLHWYLCQVVPEEKICASMYAQSMHISSLRISRQKMEDEFQHVNTNSIEDEFQHVQDPGTYIVQCLHSQTSER